MSCVRPRSHTLDKRKRFLSLPGYVHLVECCSEATEDQGAEEVTIMGYAKRAKSLRWMSLPRATVS